MNLAALTLDGNSDSDTIIEDHQHHVCESTMSEQNPQDTGFSFSQSPGSNTISGDVNSPPSPAHPNTSHLPHSDSGIVVSPQTPASQISTSESPLTHSPDASGAIAANAGAPHDDSNSSQKGFPVVVSPAPFSGANISPSASPHLNSNSLEYFSKTCLDSPRMGQQKLKRSPRHSHSHHSNGRKSPGNFTYETKYVVLQFLQRTTSERGAMGLSQSSLSNSESEKRWKGHPRAQKLRSSWQDRRSSSLPTSPRRSPRPLAKTKGNRSSPDLKEANFFQEVSPSPSQEKLPMEGRKGLNLPRRKGRHQTRRMELIRSVSDYTENSESGTYNSDADDELETSFDSSHHGSVVSQSLKEKLLTIHAERLPTVPSEAESMAEYAGSVSESTVTQESLGFTVNEHLAGDVLSLDMIQIEDTPVSPLTRFGRVSNYLAQMDGQRPLPALFGDHALGSADTTLQGSYDEVDSPPFDRTVMPDTNLMETGDGPQSRILGFEGVQEGGDADFYQSSDSGSQPLETDGEACGGDEGVDATFEIDEEDDGVGEGVDGAGAGANWQKADRSNLRLDLQCPPEAPPDVVRSLQQELEEELSSFDSEFEEGGRGHSRTCSPATAEVARILADIGDDVQKRYFDRLHEAAVQVLINSCSGSLFTYENFRSSAVSLLGPDCLDSWHKVAVLLLYSQHVALHLAQNGRHSVHNLVDYTVRLLADKAASFILTQGGWEAITALDQSSSSEEVHSTGVDPLLVSPYQEVSVAPGSLPPHTDDGSGDPKLVLVVEDGTAASRESTEDGRSAGPRSTVGGMTSEPQPAAGGVTAQPTGDGDGDTASLQSVDERMTAALQSTVDGGTLERQSAGDVTTAGPQSVVDGLTASHQSTGDEANAKPQSQPSGELTGDGETAGLQTTGGGANASSPSLDIGTTAVSSAVNEVTASPQSSPGASGENGSSMNEDSGGVATNAGTTSGTPGVGGTIGNLSLTRVAVSGVVVAGVAAVLVTLTRS
ncbi:hypothetical protein BaRGS_00028030 [Batillaria attramentaria]|uniref:Bcl-2 Bcl-2 homology region 1-3 domain-containing protein n=1 Tax=Batillaria attramentaria TaxID=370345 RepID=A0ABD0K0C8_9CAEN